MAVRVVGDHTVTRGLRPIDVTRDLGQVSELIASIFASELGPEATGALRELRTLGRMGPFLMLLQHGDNLNDLFGGYVWVESGHIVGNVTIQRADSYGNRWIIANVAVHPDYRRRGIARALMEAALEHIAERGGCWAVLQVRANNTAALTLYKRLGFETLFGITDLVRPQQASSLPNGGPPPGLRPLRDDEWHAAYTLATAATPPLAQWWKPIRSHSFQRSPESRLMELVWRLLRRKRAWRLAMPGPDGLQAMMTVQAAGWWGEHRLSFTVHPQARGRYEQALVVHGLQLLDSVRPAVVRASHDTEHQEGIAALKATGFVQERTLLTMRKAIR